MDINIEEKSNFLKWLDEMEEKAEQEKRADYDERDIEEEEKFQTVKIRMDLKRNNNPYRGKIELNKKYTYKEFCELLEEKCKVGKSKILQFKRWERYFIIVKEGHSIIVNSIKEKVGEQVDGRINNGINPNSHRKLQSFESEFSDIDLLLLDYLKEKMMTFTSINKLAEHIHFVDNNFLYSSNNKLDVTTQLYDLGKIYVKYVHTADVCVKVKKTIDKVMRSSLKRLEKDGYVEVSYGYIIISNKGNRLPDEEELLLTEKLEQEIMKKYNYEKKSDYIYNEKKSKAFYEEFDEKIKDNISDCKSFFKGVKIKVTFKAYKIKSLELEKKLELRSKLNKQLIKNTIKNLSSSIERILEKGNIVKFADKYVEKAQGGFSKLKSFNSYRIEEFYLETCLDVINAVVDIKSNVNVRRN